MSVSLHSMAYDFGNKYDNMDLSHHKEEDNDLDFFNYFFRKIFYHSMSSPGEDNFRYLIYK